MAQDILDDWNGQNPLAKSRYFMFILDNIYHIVVG
jgi:hypothetical protein